MNKVKFTVNGNWSVHNSGSKELVHFACEADRLKFDAIRVLDHVVGVNTEKHPQLPPTPYTSQSRFPEVLTLMAYLSAVTEKIKLLSGVVALPQRQTALLAKQAAEIDLLSDGRLILGVGIGYNNVEFLAMGAEFRDRGTRVEEQITLLRKLWSQPEVSFKGRWHDFQSVNINPLPRQQPIPIWMGAGRTQHPVPPEKILKRIGIYADGFMPLFSVDSHTCKLDQSAINAIDFILQTASEVGRSPSDMQLEVSLYPDGKSASQIHDEIHYLSSIGATYVHFRPNAPDLKEQLRALESLAQVRDSYSKHTGY